MPFYTDFPVYPTAILNTTDYPNQADDTDDVLADLVNALRDEMIAVQAELGTLPKGGSADVKTRLATFMTAPAFVNRGDAAGYDWEIGDLTTDATWRDLDLSGIVPAGATAVLFDIYLDDDATGSYFWMKKKGDTNDYNIAWVNTLVANVPAMYSMIAIPDTDRVVQYKGINTTFNAISLYIRGWWK